MEDRYSMAADAAEIVGAAKIAAPVN